MGGTCRVRLLLIGFVIVLALLAPAASAASDTTTSVHVVKVASDGRTVLAEKTFDYHWLESHLPVKGDGSTHYYHQGPTNDPANLWDPAESKGYEDDDMGALKGTAVRDICDQVGRMSPGDTLEVIAADGLKKRFSYGTVYSPSARQGPMVLTWYRGGDGYVPAYWSGMKIVFFADTSTNSQGWHVFGLSDMRASMPESEWYYKLEGGVKYPSTTGLAVRYVTELRISSTQAPVPAATTPTLTKTPTPTGKPSVTTIPTATATPTVTATAPPTSSLPTTGGTGTPTTEPSTTAVPSTTVPAVETTTTVPSDGSVPVVVTTTGVPTPTGSPTPTTGPTTTDGANVTVTPTGVPSPTENATANQTPNVTVPTIAPTYERTYEYSVAPEIVYVVVEQTETPTTTATVTPTVSPSPDPSAAAGPSAPAITTDEPSTPTVTLTAGPADRVFNRSVSFTFSVRVRESGDPALAASGALSAWLTAFLQAFAYIAGILLP